MSSDSDTGEPAAAVPTVEREELEAFVGKNGRVYWDLLGPSVGSRSPFVGFNVAAAALLLPWLLYRKMYVEAVVAIALGWLVHLGLVAVAGGDELSRPTLAPAYLLLVFGLGTAGNGLYLRRMRKAVHTLRSSEPDRERRLVCLAQRGGTTLVVPLVFALVAGTLIVLRRVLATGAGP